MQPNRSRVQAPAFLDLQSSQFPRTLRKIEIPTGFAMQKVVGSESDNLERDARLVVTIPETAEINAHDLAPALAAI